MIKIPQVLLGVYMLCATCIPVHADQLIPRSALFAPAENYQPQISPDGQKVAWINEVNDVARLQIYYTQYKEIKENVDLPEGYMNWFWTQGNIPVVQCKTKAMYVLMGCQNGQWKEIFSAPQPISVLVNNPANPGQLLIGVKSPGSTRFVVYVLDPQTGVSKEWQTVEGYSHVYFDGGFRLKAAVKPLTQGGNAFYVFKDDQPVLLREYSFDASSLLGHSINFISGVSYDGRYVYYTTNHTSDKVMLMQYELETGNETMLATDEDADLIWSSATYSPSTRYISSIAALFARTKRYCFNNETEGAFAYLQTLKMGDVTMLNQSVKGDKWVVRFNNGGPNKFYLYDVVTRDLQKICSENPGLDAYHFVQRIPFYVKATDGIVLPCQLYLPEGSDSNQDGIPDKPMPLIIYSHGGPWVGLQQNVWYTNRNFQLLANRGYAVVNTEFRGATFYGKNFHQKSYGEFGGNMQQDILDIVDYLIKNNIADKKRLAIWGWSYGGYNVAYFLTHHPDLFTCGLNMYGVSDVFWYVEKDDLWREWVGDPFTPAGKKKIKEISPLFDVNKIKRPMYITHGTLDKNVPIDQSDRLADEMIKQGKEVIYTVYPKEAHDYALPESWISYWAIGEQFLKKYMKGAAEPVGADLDHPNFEWKKGSLLNVE